MKKNLFMVAAVALMALVSCNKEELPNNTNGVVFVAELEQESTKTALGEMGKSGRKALWVEGDKISINGTEFSAVSGGEVAEFTTTADFTKADVYRAVYPASSYKGGAVMIPATQDGTFANASIAVAESNTNTLVFNNLSSILKFQVPVACETITFESTNSIAGNVSVTYKNGVMTPDYGSLTQHSQKITVKAVDGFKVGTDYYVAVKPGAQKFTVKIDGNLFKVSEKETEVKSSHIHNLGVISKSEFIYLDVNSEWTSDNARFTAYFFSENSNMWVNLEETNINGRYACSIPSGFSNVIFCRMNPSNSTNSWDEKYCWGKTHDLNINKNQVFKISRSWDTVDTGVWMNVEGAVISDLKSPWSIAGSFNDWGDEQLQTTTIDGLYIAKNVKLNKDASFKVKINGSWDIKYSFEKYQDIEANKWMKVTSRGDDYSVFVTADGTYDIYFSYPDKKIYVVQAGKSYSDASEQTTRPNIYLKPNSNWTQSNARFAAYFFGNGEKWVSMTTGNYYSVAVPSGYSKVIFCRMNPSATANNWNNKWNQTGDLTIPTDGKTLFTVPNGSWDGSTAGWSYR